MLLALLGLESGALILRTIVTQLGHTAFMVCDRGLRHGILAERLDT